MPAEYIPEEAKSPVPFGSPDLPVPDEEQILERQHVVEEPLLGTQEGLPEESQVHQQSQATSLQMQSPSIE